MKMTGRGEVFLADQAQDIHLIYLENDNDHRQRAEPARVRLRHRLGHPRVEGAAG